MNATTEQRLAAGRLKAVQLMPYLASALFALRPRPAPGLGTLGVTAGSVLMYDPAVVDEWSTEALGWVLLHEVCHVLRDHAGRKGARPHAAWNICGDAEINDDLELAGAKWPPPPPATARDKGNGGPILPASLGAPDGLTAEEYYARLPPPKAPQAGAGEDGEGGTQEGQGKPHAHPGRGECGGCAGGEPLPGEAEADAEDGQTPIELEATRRAVAAAIQEHAANKGRGSVPAGMERWAEEILGPPYVDWRTRLRRAARRAVQWRMGAVDLTYTRRSRRQAGLGSGPGRPVMPAYRAPVPRVTVAIDTSGSMGGESLADCMRELRGVLDAVGASVELIVCDAQVHAARPVRHLRDVRLLGGGGTAFEPIFERIARAREKPDLVVVLTDGDGSCNCEAPPGVKVLWVLIAGDREMPWGERVVIEREAA
jgi:predicted metal-dependent peptidase